MSSYYRLIVISVFFTINLFATTIKNNNPQDMLIMSAIDSELTHNYQKSAMLYTKLYSMTYQEIYLKKAVAYSLKAKDYTLLSEVSLQAIDNVKNDEQYYRYYIVSLMQQGNFTEALKVAKHLLSKYNNPKNYDLIANIYYMNKDYENAVKYFESAYASNQSVKTLLPLSDVLFVYLKQKQKAISYLETYIRLHPYNEDVYNKLLLFYKEQQNIDGMISILKMQLKHSKNFIYSHRISEQLIPLLEKKDINQAILFLEKTHVDNTKLLILYQRVGENKKALTLVRKMYKKTKDKILLGYIAILEHELAHNKQKVMKHVIANFETALKYTNNASFKNYYGYLLIDYNINIKKGLKLVKEALDQYPTNLAYMDSVAWGYYKLHRYNTAYKYMKKVVNQIGLDNNEIKGHWTKIKNKVDSI